MDLGAQTCRLDDRPVQKLWLLCHPRPFDRWASANGLSACRPTPIALVDGTTRSSPGKFQLEKVVTRAAIIRDAASTSRDHTMAPSTAWRYLMKCCSLPLSNWWA